MFPSVHYTWQPLITRGARGFNCTEAVNMSMNKIITCLLAHPKFVRGCITSDRCSKDALHVKTNVRNWKTVKRGARAIPTADETVCWHCVCIFTCIPVTDFSRNIQQYEHTLVGNWVLFHTCCVILFKGIVCWTSAFPEEARCIRSWMQSHSLGRFPLLFLTNCGHLTIESSTVKSSTHPHVKMSLGRVFYMWYVTVEK